MQLQTEKIQQGFNNPVLAAQTTFRQLLTAMSEPATKHVVNDSVSSPINLNAASYSIALTLLDQNTKVALTDSLKTPQIVSSIQFHCSVEWVDEVELADFLFCDESDESPDLFALKPGTETYPDQSCTLIIQCNSFSQGQTFKLTGPGIQTYHTIQCSAITASLFESRQKINQLFPLGIDMIFTCGHEFFCIPRSTILQPVNPPCM